MTRSTLPLRVSYDRVTTYVQSRKSDWIRILVIGFFVFHVSQQVTPLITWFAFPGKKYLRDCNSLDNHECSMVCREGIQKVHLKMFWKKAYGNTSLGLFHWSKIWLGYRTGIHSMAVFDMLRCLSMVFFSIVTNYKKIVTSVCRLLCPWFVNLKRPCCRFLTPKCSFGNVKGRIYSLSDELLLEVRKLFAQNPKKNHEKVKLFRRKNIYQKPPFDRWNAFLTVWRNFFCTKSKKQKVFFPNFCFSQNVHLNTTNSVLTIQPTFFWLKVEINFQNFRSFKKYPKNFPLDTEKGVSRIPIFA